MDPQEVQGQYLSMLMGAIRLKATAKKQSNVFHRLMGYFKKDLSGDEEQELPARILQETWSREL